MKQMLIFAALVAVLILVSELTTGLNTEALAGQIQENQADGKLLSLSDVMLNRPLQRVRKRSVGRFKRWWWCGQIYPALPGCPRSNKKHSRGRKRQQNEEDLELPEQLCVEVKQRSQQYSSKMKQNVIIATFVAVLIMMCRTTTGNQEGAMLEEIEENTANRRLRLSDVIFKQRHQRAIKRSVRRFKRWWWCGQKKPELPGCPREEEKPSPAPSLSQLMVWFWQN
ncbi:unnamed protein product [Porites lobata]|uniref:Uncharacterized protein n=1 Tax=Porites lobata TaxID=104759 RepID=A0ABN8QDE3_9CNID|nr:unnamed protein product [Porites lobata]